MLDNSFLIESMRHPNGYFNVNDNLLDGFTLNELVTSLHAGSKVIDADEVRRVAKNILNIHVQDMKNIINENIDEIIDMAYLGRIDSPVEKDGELYDLKYTKTSENLAQMIYELFCKHKLWKAVAIYYNGKEMSSSGYINGTVVFRTNGKPFYKYNINPIDYFCITRNPNIITISFSDTVYDIFNKNINYEWCKKFLNEFDGLIYKYGFYYKLVDKFVLTLYPLDEVDDL